MTTPSIMHRSISTVTSIGRNSGSRRRLLTWIFVTLLVLQFAAPGAMGAESWNYTALGDSLAFGVLAPIGGGYVPVYRDRIEIDTGVNTNLTLLAVPGWKSGDLYDALRFNPTYRFSVFSASVVTWNIGGNDFTGPRNKYKNKTCGGSDNQACLREAGAAFKANWNGIIAEILSLRGTNDTIIRTMDIYNPFVNRDKAEDTWPNDQGNDFQVLKRYVEEANTHIAVTSTANNIRYAQVYRAFNGPNGDIDPSDLGYISSDGLHANGRGHRKMAELLGDLGYSPLRP